MARSSSIVVTWISPPGRSGGMGGKGGKGGGRALIVTSLLANVGQATCHALVPIGGSRSGEIRNAMNMHDLSSSRSLDLLGSGRSTSRIHIGGNITRAKATDNNGRWVVRRRRGWNRWRRGRTGRARAAVSAVVSDSGMCSHRTRADLVGKKVEQVATEERETVAVQAVREAAEVTVAGGRGVGRSQCSHGRTCSRHIRIPARHHHRHHPQDNG
eukprot:7238002-Prymnesium_polylepis.1